MKEENKISLLVKIEGPVIVGKIDISKIDSNTRPKGMNKNKLKKIEKLCELRERIDSGWSWSLGTVIKNYKNKKIKK